MTHDAIVCQACGAKVRASRSRCPRCRAVLVTKAPSEEVHLSGNAAKIAGGVLAVALVATVVILWRSGDASPPPTSTVRPAAPAAAAPTTAPAASADVPPAPSFELAPGLTRVMETTDDAAVLAALQKGLERDPQDAAAMYNIGHLLLRQRKPALAVAPLKQAFALKGDDWSYAFSAGYAQALAGQFREAARAFRAARALMPTDATTSYDLALALHRSEDLAGAVEEYGAAIGLNSAGRPAQGRPGRLARSPGQCDRSGQGVRGVPAGNVRRDRRPIKYGRGWSGFGVLHSEKLRTPTHFSRNLLISLLISPTPPASPALAQPGESVGPGRPSLLHLSQA